MTAFIAAIVFVALAISLDVLVTTLYQLAEDRKEVRLSQTRELIVGDGIRRIRQATAEARREMFLAALQEARRTR